MNTNVISKKTRSGAFDLLRFIAVLIIFFAHYSDSFNHVHQIVPSNLKYTPVFRYGTAAILIFFMVSAFVVTMTSMKRTAKEFIMIRLSRLYPLFWLSCIAGFLLIRFSPWPVYIPYPSTATLLANLTMFPNLLGFNLINPVYHTLVSEMIFYFSILFVLAFKLWNRILPILTVLTVLCYAGLLYNMYFPVMLTSFIGGMLFYFIQAKKYTQWKVYTLAGFNALAAILCARPLTYSIDSFYKTTGAGNIWIFAAIITSIYILFLLITLKKINIKGNIVFQKLGELSFPFFLFHLYFLGIYWYLGTKMNGTLLLIGLAVAITIFSLLVNLYVEKPLNELAIHIIESSKTLRKRALRRKKSGLAVESGDN